MNLNMNIREKREAGFTLLELLIVVSIIAILSVALVLVLNPAETLKKSRDAQRMSDLSTLKTALSLYLTSTTTPYMGGISSNTTCKATPNGAYVSGDMVYYSYNGATTVITDATLDAGSGSTPDAYSTTTPSLTDGTGWIPVYFDSLTGGSPISNIPTDPVNAISDLAAVAGVAVGNNPPDYVYRYACAVTPLTFEIDAVLESTAYTSTENKMTSDGGNSTAYYEVGTNLKILGAGSNNTDY